MTKAFAAIEKARNKTSLIHKTNKEGDGTLFQQLPPTDKSGNLQRKKFSNSLLFPCCSAPIEAVNNHSPGSLTAPDF